MAQFRTTSGAGGVPTDPEQLYRQLTAATTKSPAALWVHQADVLRAWHGEHVDIGNHRNQNLLNGGVRVAASR